MKDIKKILNLPIVSETQLGGIKIGTNMSDFKKEYVKENYINDGNLKVFTDDNFSTYLFFNSVSFSFSIKTNKLVRIYLSNKFTGKYLDIIGIGSSLKEISLASDKFKSDRNGDDDGEYWIENKDGYIDLEVNNKYRWYKNDDEMSKCKVERIALETY